MGDYSQQGSQSDRQPKAWERDLLHDVLTASLKEQRSARRWKIFFRFFWTFLILGYFLFLFSMRAGTQAEVSERHVAVVDVKGAIAADEQASAQAINEALRSAFRNKSSVAVVLRINSPGGSPVQAEMVYDEIRRLRALHNKPVYAVVEDAGASAAYYIAAAADEVYVSRSSIVGSIGVLTNQFGFVGLMDKLGIERRLITSGGHKGMMDPFSPMRVEDQAFVENMLNRVHEQFIDAVKTGRGERLKIDEDTFSGLFWIGQEAIDRGLADGLGTVDQVARDHLGVDRLVNYSPQKSFAERLARQLGAGVGDVAVDAVTEQSLGMR